jgi:hypothetical protein
MLVTRLAASPSRFDWATTIAAAALGLSLVNAIAGILVLWWRQRAASFEVRLEMIENIERLKHMSGFKAVKRIVLVNHGRAIARDVRMHLTDEKGVELKPGYESDSWQEPYPVINSGQSFYILISGITPKKAKITWKDKRIKRQELTTWLSIDHIV